MLKKILISGLSVSVCIFLGRIVGFVRELCLASTFGTSSSADVAVLILTVPDLLVSLLIGGALANVLIPVLKRMSDLEAKQLFVQALLVIALTFSVLALFLTTYSELVVKLFAPGLDQAALTLAYSGVLQLSLWVLPLTALAGVTTAYLQANDRFVLPALGTFFYNSVLILFLLAASKAHDSIFVLSVAIVLAGTVRLLSQLFTTSLLSVNLIRLILHLTII